MQRHKAKYTVLIYQKVLAQILTVLALKKH